MKKKRKTKKKQLSVSKRKEALQVLLKEGWQAACERFAVSKGTLSNWKKAWDLGGEDGLIPKSRKPKRYGRLKVYDGLRNAIVEYKKANPTASCQKIQRYLKKQHYNVISLMTIWRVLKKNQPKDSSSKD